MFYDKSGYLKKKLEKSKKLKFRYSIALDERGEFFPFHPFHHHFHPPFITPVEAES